jgi:hypothetical protein
MRYAHTVAHSAFRNGDVSFGKCLCSRAPSTLWKTAGEGGLPARLKEFR